MGLFSSKEYDKQLAQYEKELNKYVRTIDAIEAYEREAWQSVLPGPIRLLVYWVQMLLCGLETIPRIAFHAVMWLLVLPFALMAMGFQKLMRPDAPSGNGIAKNARKPLLDVDGTVAVEGDGEPWLPVRQMMHHQSWMGMYTQMFPPVIYSNLMHPFEPLFADGVDISIYRPVKPQKPRKPGDLCGECGDACCDNKACDCQECGNVAMAVIRLFRSSFVFLGGYHALQCGSCLGPCVRPICYDPCVGEDINRGICRICEVDEIRLRRWARELHEAKMERSQAFYNSHPELMRPPKRLLPPTSTPQAVLAAPGQAAIDNKV